MKHYSSTPRVLGAFAAIGAATVATQADASIVFVDFTSNPSSFIPYNIDGVYINVTNGATGTSSATTAGWDLNPYFTGSGTATASLAFFASTTGDANRGVVTTPFTLGATIGSGSTFGTGAQSGAQFNAAGGYLGFRFTNETTGQINFGWALFTSTGANPVVAGTIRLTGFAYENTGLSINAGDTGVIPEPTTIATLGMMAAGALGLRQWRRRKVA